MRMRKRFIVQVTREDPWWVGEPVEVRDDTPAGEPLPGAAVEVRRLDRLEDEVRAGLTLFLDLDSTTASELDLELRITLPGAAGPRVLAFHDRADYLDTARRDYTKALYDAVDELTATGISVRDAAHLLGLSFQRVQQVRTGHHPHDRRTKPA